MSNVIFTGYLIRCLQKGDQTVGQICRETGTDQRTVRKYLKQWHSMRLVYISSYAPTRFQPTARWSLLTDKCLRDAVKPRVSAEEKKAQNQKYEARKGVGAVWRGLII